MRARGDLLQLPEGHAIDPLAHPRRAPVDDPLPLEAQLPRGQTVLPRQVIVHFDGACEPPGTGGIATYGFTVDGEGFEWEDGGLAVRPHAPTATNNVAEYVAAICALEWLVAHAYNGPVLARGDSQLVIRQMNGEYEVRTEHLRAYHERLRQLRFRFEEVTFEWVPREENRRADALSKLALKEAREAESAGTDAERPGPGSRAGPEKSSGEEPNATD